MIRPALEVGEVVVCDRFFDSTTAYQGCGHGLAAKVIDELYALTVGDFRPDLTIILDQPVEEGLRRAAARNGDLGGAEDRYERMGLEFHRRLRQGFLDIAAANPQRCAVISAEGSVEDVQSRIFSTLSLRLNLL